MNTLSGIERAMTIVGRSVANSPRTTVGRMVSMNAKTTQTAKRKPNIASWVSVSICSWMSGPWSDTITMPMSGGSPVMPLMASRTADVTSIVFASGVFTTDTLTLRWPFVREILVGAPTPKLTSATSRRRTGPDADAPTTRSSISWTEPKACVVLAITARPPSSIRPAGSDRLFSLRAADTWSSDSPFDASLSGSTLTATRRSISPAVRTRRMPSTSEIAGRTRDWTTRWISATSRSETTLNCMTGISLGFSLPTAGSPTPAGKVTPFTAALTSLSAPAISVPNTNVASTRELPSFVIDSTVSRPSIPVMARSTGAVTARRTASGPADGYRTETVTSGNSISGKSSTLRDR